METETKQPPLQKEWEERKRLRKEWLKLREEGNKLRDEANKLWEEGDKLRVEGLKLWDEGEKLRVEGEKLKDEGWKLRVEGSILWYDAVRRYYGKDVKVTWRKWHKDNDMTCHINSDVYV